LIADYLVQCSMVASAGPLATISCEPRQARKGAAAAVISGAEVWPVEDTSLDILQAKRLL